MAANIKSISARNTYISSTYAVGTWIGCAGIRGACTRCICARGAFAESVKSKALAKLEVILIGLELNDCCFLSFIGWIFTSIERISC